MSIVPRAAVAAHVHSIVLAPTSKILERERYNARRRALQEVGMWPLTLEAKLQRAAYGAVRRASLRSLDDAPSDAEIAAYWVDSVALVVARTDRWLGRKHDMKNALDVFYRGAGDIFSGRAKTIRVLARSLWFASHARMEAAS